MNKIAPGFALPFFARPYEVDGHCFMGAHMLKNGFVQPEPITDFTDQGLGLKLEVKTGHEQEQIIQIHISMGVLLSNPSPSESCCAPFGGSQTREG